MVENQGAQRKGQVRSRGNPESEIRGPNAEARAAFTNDQSRPLAQSAIRLAVPDFRFSRIGPFNRLVRGQREA